MFNISKGFRKLQLGLDKIAYLLLSGSVWTYFSAAAKSKRELRISPKQYNGLYF